MINKEYIKNNIIKLTNLSKENKKTHNGFLSKKQLVELQVYIHSINQKIKCLQKELNLFKRKVNKKSETKTIRNKNKN